MSEIKVSIVIPVYNVEKYIYRCLVSVTKQKCSNMIECLIINDKTPDGSVKIINEFISNYNGFINFKLINHSENQGLSASRNSGILEASGDYIYFLDSDDEISDDCITNLFNIAISYHYPDMIVGSTQSIGQKRDWLLLENKGFPEFTNNEKWIRKQMFSRYQIPMIACNKLIRREWLIKNKLFFKVGILHEDELWNFKVANCINSIGFCTEPSYYYYTNPNSIMTINNTEKRISSLKIILYEMINSLQDKCELQQVKYIISIYKILFSLTLTFDSEIENNLIQSTNKTIYTKLYFWLYRLKHRVKKFTK